VRYQLKVLAVTLPFVAGCYSYARIEPTEVQPGVAVRARLTTAAGDHVAPLLGSTPRQLTGKLISEGRDTVVMEVPSVTQAAVGSTVQTLHQRVSVPKAGVIEWEIRTLNRPRTYALVGGATAIFAAVMINVLKGDPASERLPGGGGVDALVPLFRISR